MIPRQQRQEDLSLAYLLAVVARLGMTFNPEKRDFGIDGTISRVVMKNRKLLPSPGLPLRVQLKSSIEASFDDNHVKYALNV